ncbi:MAG: DUF4359 domain-containing protein [Prevotella sp.]|nr:DUF4359 domain-containing protein [Prevotella sp.]
MKKILWIVIVLLVGVLMFITAPAEEKHKEAMMKAVREYIDEEAANRGFKDNGITRLGKNVVAQAVKTALNSKLKFDNYYLFNMTHVKLGSENKVLSLGIFGKVFTFDKDMLRENLEEALRTKEVEKVQKAAAKEEARELKRQLRQQRKLEKKLAREKRRQEKKAAREAKRKAKKQ